MYSNKRTNQGGSVAVFLIVSVLLAAAVIGGVYFVHQRGEQVRSVQPIAQQPTPQNQPQQGTQQDPDAAKKQEEARKQAEAAKQAEEAKKKADQETKQKQAQEQAAKEQAEKQRAAQNKPPQPTTVPQTGTGHLPDTGPSDTLMQLVAAGIMIAIVGAYLRSYRHRFGSILR